MADEKKYKKALRYIYKFGSEANKLTDEALEVCKRQGINPDELTSKTAEDFTEKSLTTGLKAMSPTSIYQMDLVDSEANLASVRAKHHETRRYSKCPISPNRVLTTDSRVVQISCFASLTS